MQGQIYWYRKVNTVKELYQSVFDRYENETYRIYAVLEKQLEEHDWIALDRLTVVGMV